MQNQGIEKYGEGAYGPGGSLVDTNSKFNVKNEFVSTTDQSEFWKMRTTLTQGSGEVVLESECPEYLRALNYGIDGGMGIVFANWNNEAGSEDFELDYGQSAGGCENASTTISNFEVRTSGSTEDKPDDGSPKRVIGDVAPNVDDCGDPLCTGCNKAWLSDDVDNVFDYCTDKTSYKYWKPCESSWDTSLCGSDDKCFTSYPANDRKKTRSEDYGCRPLPDRLETGDYKFQRKKCRSTNGLCALGCDDGQTCHSSWPKDDPKAWRSAD